MSDFYQHEGTTYEVDSDMLDKFLADKPGATKINFQDTLPTSRASSSEDTSFGLQMLNSLGLGFAKYAKGYSSLNEGIQLGLIEGSIKLSIMLYTF